MNPKHRETPPQSAPPRPDQPQPDQSRSGRSWIARAVIALVLVPVHLYRYLISPLLGSNCRFSPSCSSYAIEAIQLHGVVKGGYLTAQRMRKCHPFGGSGYDPVPKQTSPRGRGAQDAE